MSALMQHRIHIIWLVMQFLHSSYLSRAQRRRVELAFVIIQTGLLQLQPDCRVPDDVRRVQSASADLLFQLRTFQRHEVIFRVN